MMNSENRKQDIQLEITATQKAGKEKNIQKQKITGERIQHGQTVYFRYAEKIEENGPNAQTTIRIHADAVYITRKGALKSTMEFRNHEETVCHYETTAGHLTFQIRTKQIKWTVMEHENQLLLRYELLLGEERLSENEIYIAVKEI